MQNWALESLGGRSLLFVSLVFYFDRIKLSFSYDPEGGRLSATTDTKPASNGS